MSDNIEGVLLESSVVKWEYFCKYVTHGYMEEDLDTYGEQGWEAVSILPSDDLLLIVFKRPLTDEDGCGDKTWLDDDGPEM